MAMTGKDTKRAPAVPKFDPDEARRQLKEFLDADQDVPSHHPLYPLSLLLSAWEDAQEAEKRDYTSRLGADKGVGKDEARTMLSVGSLDSDDDYMLVHTRQALRLFIGRGRDPEGKLARIPSTNVGSALRNLWQLSGQDNPYADWMLILSEFEIDDLMKQLGHAVAEARGRIETLSAEGMHLSILKSRDPAKVTLGFRSPYGFLISRLVMDFDLYVRVVKTLAGRDLISAEKERELLNARLRPMRAFFDRVLRNQNVLQVPAYATDPAPTYSTRKARTSRTAFRPWRKSGQTGRGPGAAKTAQACQTRSSRDGARDGANRTRGCRKGWPAMSHQGSREVGYRMSSRRSRDRGLPLGNAKGFKGKGAGARRRG